MREFQSYRLQYPIMSRFKSLSIQLLLVVSTVAVLDAQLPPFDPAETIQRLEKECAAAQSYEFEGYCNSKASAAPPEPGSSHAPRSAWRSPNQTNSS